MTYLTLVMMKKKDVVIGTLLELKILLDDVIQLGSIHPMCACVHARSPDSANRCRYIGGPGACANIER